MLNYHTFPAELKCLPNWVVWRTEKRFKGRKNEKATKIPYEPKTGEKAKSNDSKTWSSFEAACTVAHQHPLPGVNILPFNGIGFVFAKEYGYLGIDIDHCRNPETGTIEPWAQRIIDALKSYTEVSPSGTGVHIYVKAKLKGTGRRKGKIEFYDQGRYFTVTGHHLEGTPLEVHERQSEIDQLYQEFFEEETQPTDNQPDYTTTTQPLDIFELTRRSQNDNKFQSLFAGNTSGYPSQSEADLALCCKLVFYTQGDFLSIDKFFRVSGLFRPKWDEKHGARTYGDMTTMKALQVQREYYTPAIDKPQLLNKPEEKPTQAIEEHPTEKQPSYQITDMGNGERFAFQHQGKVRFCPEWEKWLIWTGTHWQRDEALTVERLAKHTVRSIYHEASEEEDDKKRKKIVQHGLKSEEFHKLKCMINTAKSEATITVIVKQLDTHPHLINVQNGTLDLTTGELHPHDPNQLITYYLDVPYQKNAQCPTWLKFLDKIMASNQTLIHFLQRAAGYSLTSSTKEQCLFFLHGDGRNGKTTFVETLFKYLMGDYAKKLSMDALVFKEHSRIPNDIAELPGVRAVYTSEVQQNSRLNEALVKDITGGDTVSARFMRANWFRFTPEFKLWMYGNHRPVIIGMDEGIWRRIKLIPFKVQISDQEKDGNLQDKLLKELPGILAWVVEGCLLWRKQGLEIPQDVFDATRNYRNEMDTIELFLQECCVFKPFAKSTAKELYGAYSDWCQGNGEVSLSQKKLGERLTKKGIERGRSTGGQHVWNGINLVVKG